MIKLCLSPFLRIFELGCRSSLLFFPTTEQFTGNGMNVVNLVLHELNGV